MEFIGESYDPRLYEPITEGTGGTTSLVISNKRTTDSGRAFYYVVMAKDGSHNIPISNTAFGFGFFFKSKIEKECRTEERDILAPVIRPRFDSGSQVLAATIHDHGMPLAELEIEVTARSDSVNNIVNWGHQSSGSGSLQEFTFQNGILNSPFTLPPRGEFFTLRIDAQDKAGNRPICRYGCRHTA